MLKVQSIKPRIFSHFSAFLLVLGLIGNAATKAAPTVITLSSNASLSEIQEALDGLPVNGEVHLGPGTFELQQPLMLSHSFITLSGSGPTTVLFLAAGSDCPVVVIGPAMKGKLEKVSHIRLANVLIDGNRKHQKTEHWRLAPDGSVVNNNGVQVWDANDVAVEHVACRACRSGGLVSAEVRRLAVTDFESYNNQFDGLACYETEESQFAGLRLHDNLAAGISLDLAFNHNLVTNAVIAGNDSGIFMRHSRNNDFKGLIISRSRHHGIFMAQVAEPTRKSWRIFPDTQCVGNHFENLNVSNCGGDGFKVNDASCTNNIISGARFLNNIQGGMSQPTTNPVVLREVAYR
jgi:hypothetical protein